MDLSKEVQEAIARIMAEDGGHLSLEQFIDWQLGQDWIEQVMANVAADHPDHSPEEVRSNALLSTIADLDDGWLRRGVARRLTLDDPAELGRFLSMNSRIAFLWYGDIPDNDDEFLRVWDVLRGLAARDLQVVRALVKSATFPLKRGYTPTVLLYNGVNAVLKKDWPFLRSFEPTLSARKVSRWYSAAYLCLRGILQKSPEVVAEGLDNLLRARSPWSGAGETPTKRVICLEAHGLYELARGVSPELVSAFDVDRPLPWDRGFHDWARANQAP